MRLLESLLRHKGSVILSGYDNPLYNSVLQGWKKASRRAAVEAGQSKVEVIWMNFDVGRQLELSLD